jgi:nicotinamidase-related amidase
MDILLYFLVGLAIYTVIRAVLLVLGMRPTRGRKIAGYRHPRKALLVVDIQEDYTGIDAPRSSPFKNTAAFVNIVNKVIEVAFKKRMLIIYISHEWPNNIFYRVVSRGLALAGQPGTRQDDRLAIASAHYFSKHKPDAFSNANLEDLLIRSQVDEVFIVGLDAAGCVYKTALGALNRNYKVSIIIDAVITCMKRTREQLTGMYQHKGIAVVESTEFAK